MQASAQKLSDGEAGRLRRTCARLAVSTLLFFRGALPRGCFKVVRCNGVPFPVLDQATGAGGALTALIESGMRAARGGTLQAVEVCLYLRDRGDAAPPTTNATPDDSSTPPCPWHLAETYHIDLLEPVRLRKHDVPKYLDRMKADFVTTSVALDPLPPDAAVGVGLRNVHAADGAGGRPPAGFEFVTRAPCRDGAVCVTHAGDSVWVEVGAGERALTLAE